MFGVLDGHGGPEVSAVVSRKFPAVLTENRSFKEGNYEKALRETFRVVDSWLRGSEGMRELVEEKLKLSLKDSIYF